MVEEYVPTNTPTSTEHFRDSFTLFIPTERQAGREEMGQRNGEKSD